MENEAIRRIDREGRQIVLIGTAHVSRESAELVEQVIEEERPNTVCIELCRPRFEALQQQDQWQQTDIVKVIRE
ncbi:MAG: TraB/GumN family protein, partial [Syntrophaceae bacterium]|nr:TraB/GumN family protein [Syntrophaceae bacterium]